MRRLEQLEHEQHQTALAPRLEPFAVRDAAIEAAGRFGSTFTDDNLGTRSYAALMPAALQLSEQLEREELPGYTTRAKIRARLADKIEAEVFPLWRPRWLERYPMRLRTARQSGAFGVQVATGRPVVYWDHKAGLSRLCPDDAREEAMRLHRRNEPTLREWTERGPAHRITYAVFTTPNNQQGDLLDGMRTIFEKFKRTILASGEFPAIKGALCVLEAPLGRERDWNVHLNVLLLHDGFVDWGKIRRLWHWNVHMAQLSRDPGAIGSALRELIKYAVAATVSKSEAKAHVRSDSSHVGGVGGDTGPRVGSDRPGGARGVPADSAGRTAAPDGHGGALASPPGDYPAPPMLEWTGTEVAEWLKAFHGFRRTRGYGQLYGLTRLDPPALGAIAWLGRVLWQGGRFVHRLALLDSIPEDKSARDAGPLDPRTSWKRFRHRLRLDLVRAPEPVPLRLAEIQAAIASHPLIIGTR
jgi:hypothetical protein